MRKTANKVEDLALSLPPKRRRSLTRKLIRSLKAESQRNVDQAWVEEAERRFAAYERGEMKVESLDSVLKALRTKIRNGH